jgi:transcription initiation factor TFIID subunit 6
MVMIDNKSFVLQQVVMTAHWLAIEGVQPAIPQNPAVAEDDVTPSLAIASAANGASNGVIGNAAAGAVAGGVSSLASNSSTLTTTKSTTVTTTTTTTMIAAGDASTQSSSAAVDTVPLVKHQLSAELQAYYQKIVNAVQGKLRSSRLFLCSTPSAVG